MSIMDDIIIFLVPTMAVMMFAFAGAIVYTKGGFSLPIFLICMSVGFGIAVWIGMLPPFMLSLVALMLGVLLFSNSDDSDGDSNE